MIKWIIKNQYKNKGLPGFHCKASIPLIVQSCDQLINFSRTIKNNKIFLPAPGIGNGGLTSKDSNFLLYLEILKLLEKEPNIEIVTYGG